MKRRRFREPSHQTAYDQLRAMRPDVEDYRGFGGGGNAYAVGYTLPDQPNRAFPKGSKSYAHWAAGVDNARDDREVKMTGRIKAIRAALTRARGEKNDA